MIVVDDLRKVYGEYEALRGLTFSVSKGEVVGFLGPNGAGKTTTMRILTGFIPATGGRARVAGFDVFEDSLEVRKRLGYLPENVPLYTDMRVEEYLSFRAAIKRIPSFERSAAIQRVLKLCWLDDSKTRIIGHLSKGFRQRVGLADALLGSPEVLILDEPTVGLDPNQVRETRKLIKSLAETHTVILSTHILHEVEMICSRVIIVNEGKIVADGTQEHLVDSMSDSRRLMIELRGEGPRAAEEIIRNSSGVSRHYLAFSDEILRIEIDQMPGADLRETLSQAFMSAGYSLREFRSERFTLEDIFARLTSDKFVGLEPPAVPAEVLEEPSEEPQESTGDEEPVNTDNEPVESGELQEDNIDDEASQARGGE